MGPTLRTASLASLMFLGVVLPVASTTPTTASDAVAMVATPVRMPVTRPVRPAPEDSLLQVLSTFRAGNVDGALSIVDSLIVDQPNYRLAHLLRGDILSVRAGQPVSVEQPPHNDTAVNNLLAEARQRWQGHAFVPGDRLPAPLLKPGRNHSTIIFVDLALSRLFLFDNRGERPELIADYYVSSGKNGVGKRRKGDKKTPLGVYFVTQRLPGEEPVFHRHGGSVVQCGSSAVGIVARIACRRRVVLVEKNAHQGTKQGGLVGDAHRVVIFGHPGLA